MTSAQIVSLVAKREISTKIRDKTFLISTAIFIVIIAGIVGFNVLLSQSGSSYSVGTVGQLDPAYKKAIESGADAQDLDVTLVSFEDKAAAEKSVRADDTDVVIDGTTLIAEQDVDVQLRAVLESANQSVQQAQQIEQSGLDPGEVQQALTVAPFEVVALDPNAKNSTQRGVVAIIAVGIVYFMLLTSAQFVAQGVVEEKASRVVELLMATVKPWQLLAGKVIGLGLLSLMQLVLILGVGLGIGLGSGLLDVPSSAISTVIQVFAWFILGFAFFASMFAAAASLVSRQEDLGSAIGALSLIPVLAFFGAFAALNSPNGLLAHVLSLVPGFSPITMPVRSAMTSVPIWEYGLAVLLQVVAIVLIIRLAGRVYAGAMLRTGGKVKLKEALSSTD